MDVPDKILGMPTWAVLLGAVAAIYLYKKGIAGTTAAIIGGAGQAAGQVASGAVVGIGQAVGIPATNTDQCNAAIAAGDTWNASLYCPAATFLKYLGV